MKTKYSKSHPVSFGSIQKNHHTVDTFIEATNNDIDAVIKKLKQPKCSNLSEKEQKALEELKVRDDIVITNAEKRGAVIILVMKCYVEECERQLNNTQNCKCLQKDLTVTNNELVYSVIKRFENEKLVHENITEGLKINSARTPPPQFYTQPKIHQRGNLGRPVISSVSCHTSKISEYVDYHLQPIIKQIPSYVKYTSVFISKLKSVQTVADNSYLVSLDVKSLYINIPNSEGIKAVKTSLDNSPRKTIATKVITTFLSLIQSLSNFVFNYINDIQIKGCTMGTICTPSFANIFMDHFKRRYIYPFLQRLSLIYLRFIDDIFFIRTGKKEQLIRKLNE